MGSKTLTFSSYLCHYSRTTTSDSLFYSTILFFNIFLLFIYFTTPKISFYPFFFSLCFLRFLCFSNLFVSPAPLFSLFFSATTFPLSIESSPCHFFKLYFWNFNYSACSFEFYKRIVDGCLVSRKETMKKKKSTTTASQSHRHQKSPQPLPQTKSSKLRATITTTNHHHKQNSHNPLTHSVDRLVCSRSASLLQIGSNLLRHDLPR